MEIMEKEPDSETSDKILIDKIEEKNEKKKEEVKIKIMENNVVILIKKLNTYSLLTCIRNELYEISFPFIFLDSLENDILTNQESNKILKDILDGKILYIKKQIEKRNMKGIKISRIGDLNFYLYPSEPFTHEEKDNSLNIIIMGETGVGKSTFIHSILNYLEGIQIEEKDRYYVFEPEKRKIDGHSVTEHCTIYDIKPTKVFNYRVRLIDTPGLGDTRGKGIDEKNILGIADLFQKDIEYLNAIIIIFKASDTRDHKREKEIIDELLSLFGLNIINNIIIAFTFVDDITDIKALKTLKDPNGPFKKILGDIENFKPYGFNNQAYFTNQIEAFKIAFKNNTKNYKELLEKISTLKKISIKDSEEVIKKRNFIKNRIYNLINELKNIVLEINVYKSNLFTYQDFHQRLMKVYYGNDNNSLEKYKEKIIYNTLEEKWENCEENMYILYCSQCRIICHSKCHGPNEGWHSSEYGCNVIYTFFGGCSNCECNYKKHEFRKTRPVLRQVRKEIEVDSYRLNPNIVQSPEDKKREVKNLIDNINIKEAELLTIKNRINSSIEGGLAILKVIAEANDRLNQIALKKDIERYGFAKKILKEKKRELNVEMIEVFNIFENKLDYIQTENIETAKRYILEALHIDKK